jgi:predicted RNase H-like HicB family nuclease
MGTEVAAEKEFECKMLRAGVELAFGGSIECHDHGRQMICLTVNLEREDDGRWIAEIRELPGVLVYGQTEDDAVTKVKALCLRVLADRLEHGESVPEMDELFSVTS